MLLPSKLDNFKQSKGAYSMAYLITKRVNVVFFILACFLKMAPIHAEKLAVEPRKFTVLTGGYSFGTAYKLYLPSQSSTIVRAWVGRGTAIAKSKRGPITPTEFCVRLQSIVNNRLITPEAYLHKNGHVSIMELKKRDAKETYPIIKTMLGKLARLYVQTDADTMKNLDREHKKFSRYNKRIGVKALLQKSPSTVRIKPFKNLSCLNARYTLYPMMPYTPRIRVDVLIRYETGMGTDKLVVTGTAKFAEKNGGPYSELKFEVTKNGLRELIRGNMRPSNSSIWYRQAKKLVQKSIKKFLKFQKVHENSFQNGVL